MSSGPTKILLIEDDVHQADVCRRQLARCTTRSFAIEHTGTLAAGLKRLEREGIDIVLLDLGLPDSQGISTFLRLRERLPDVPVVILTGIDDEAMGNQAMRQGAQEFICKGRANGGLLERTICYALERHKILADLRSQRHVLSSSEARYRQMIDNNADGIVVVDPEGVIQYANPSAERTFGRGKDELIGQDFGFPLVAGETTEIDILCGQGKVAVVEMRVVETDWENHCAYLVSLRDTTELVRLREKLEELSINDELTGVYNRRGFLTLAEQQMKLVTRTNTAMVLFFADLDGLKLINDRLGHHEGDRAIAATADILKHTFRDSDIIGRLGGDEFAVLAMGLDGENPANIVKRLEEKIRIHNAANPERKCTLSLSVGTAHYDVERPCSIDELLARADARMYELKTGKYEKAGTAPRDRSLAATE